MAAGPTSLAESTDVPGEQDQESNEKEDCPREAFAIFAGELQEETN